MPEVLYQRLKVLYKEHELHVFELNNVSNDYVVQRNKISSLIGTNFVSLHTVLDKDKFIIDFLTNNDIDIIHVESDVEQSTLSEKVMEFLYSPVRRHRMVETIHNSFIGNETKRFIPDGYALCNQWQCINKFKSAENHCQVQVCSYPILPLGTEKPVKKLLNNKINILQVGLWTPGKNQSDTIEIANEIERLFPGKYHFNFVGNQAPNFIDYWYNIKIPSNVTVWGEREDIDQFYKESDLVIFNSVDELSPIALWEAISYGKKTLVRRLPQYGSDYDGQVLYMRNSVTDNANLLHSFHSAVKMNYTPIDESDRFKTDMITLYQNVCRYKPVDQLIIYVSYNDGVKCEIIGRDNYEYNVKFIDKDKNHAVYQTNIKCGRWCSPSRKWFTNWGVDVTSDNPSITIRAHHLDIQNKKVGILFESSSLGDTLSWVGQVSEFQKLNNLELDVYTHRNGLFKDSYSNMNFVDLWNPNKYYATYKIGVYTDHELPWDANRNKNQWNTVPLGQICTDTLGFDYKEIRPVIAVNKKEIPIKEKYVCIATHSTAQAKFWNNPTGWLEVINFLLESGYRVFNISNENLPIVDGMELLPSYDMDTTIQYLNNADFFIGLSSGLSWLSWALGVHCFMISGFTPSRLEFEQNCTRLINKEVCNGCWETNYFDKGKWNWCPIQEKNEKMFECSKTISSFFVISNIKYYLKS